MVRKSVFMNICTARRVYKRVREPVYESAVPDDKINSNRMAAKKNLCIMIFWYKIPLTVCSKSLDPFHISN